MGLLWVALAVAGALVVSGCATVTRGLNQQVQFNSDPPEALVRTSMGHSCTTPCTLQFSRKDEFSATFSKPGFVTETVPVTTQLAGTGAAGFAGNIILGGVVGMGVDAATGATLEHCPNPVTVRLRREGSNAMAPTPHMMCNAEQFRRNPPPEPTNM